MIGVELLDLLPEGLNLVGPHKSALQVSSAAGLIVAIAVLAHDFDGANTVTSSFASGGGVPAARCWLLIDAVAPLVAIVLARLLDVSPSIHGLLLAVFAGGLLYIGASELLPRSREGEARITQVGATWLGLIFVYVVVHLAAL